MGTLTPAGKIIRTTRPLRSALLYSIVFFGYLVADFSWPEALYRALPMLLISLAGFCINDIFDQEQDRINHPNRTLAKHPSLSKSVTVAYVILFASSIFIISLQRSPTDKFLWAFLFIALSNYSFFKRNFPGIKNIYVALAAALPAAILDFAHDGALSSLHLYGPLVFAVFARELACDIPDIAGDGKTLANGLGPKWSWYLVVLIYVLVMTSLVVMARSQVDMISAMAGALGLILYVIVRIRCCWPESSLLIFSGPIVVSPAVLLIN